jgi:regulator of sirC expression with transglutaminase-like and TPR domain
MVNPLYAQAPTALQYFAALVANDDGLPLLEAAAVLSLYACPEVDVQGVLSSVDALSARFVQRQPADQAPLQRLRLFNRYFFRELGFAGNVNDYYDPRNSYLPEVLKVRRGIPISLAVLYVEMAGLCGLPAQGVSFPGHYLVKLRMPGGEVVIDPFNGQSLSREDLDERLLPYRQRQGLVGDDEVPLGLFLQAATARDTLARMLLNLREIHRSAHDLVAWLAVQERLVVLLPHRAAERRDLALLRAELGQWDLAILDLEACLQAQPDAADAPQLRTLLADWLLRTPQSGQQASRLH